MIGSSLNVLLVPGRLAVLAVLLIFLRGLYRYDHGDLLTSVNLVPPSVGHTADRNSVSVQLYIESLCIDSKVYVLDQFMPTFRGPLSEVMDVEVVVFGNAHLQTASQSVTCQHGDGECDANIYEQCAIDNFIYPSRYLPFLACLFDTLPMGHADNAYEASYFSHCARAAALDFSTLQTCHQKEGWAMQVQSSSKTPKHDHVPWLVVDGVHVAEDSRSLAQIVCETLKSKGGQHSFCDTISSRKQD